MKQYPYLLLILFAFSSSQATALSPLQTVLNAAREHPIVTAGVVSFGGFYVFKKSLDYYLQQHVAPLSVTLHRSLDEEKEYCYLFSHGIADSQKQADPYLNTDIIRCPLVTFNFADSWNGKLRLNYTQSSFGQENEIERLEHVYNDHCASKKTILMGVSRGAAVAINFAASNPPSLSALLLESPYDCADNAVAALVRRLLKIPFRWVGSAIVSFVFGKYKKDGIHPIDQVAKIRKDMPILIFCLEGDTTVPVSSSVNLYTALKNSGHSNTYLYALPAGATHARVIYDQKCIPLMQQVTHAFYKKHNLPYDPALALAGEPLLQQCQP